MCGITGLICDFRRPECDNPLTDGKGWRNRLARHLITPCRRHAEGPHFKRSGHSRASPRVFIQAGFEDLPVALWTSRPSTRVIFLDADVERADNPVEPDTGKHSGNSHLCRPPNDPASGGRFVGGRLHAPQT
jgi:hypothetical protein